MNISNNILNAFANAPSPPIFCAAGSMCPHESKIVTDVGKHNCRECEKPMHGYICSDGTVEDMNGMICLLCTSNQSKVPDDWTTDNLAAYTSFNLRDDGNDTSMTTDPISSVTVMKLCCTNGIR